MTDIDWSKAPPGHDWHYRHPGGPDRFEKQPIKEWSRGLWTPRPNGHLADSHEVETFGSIDEKPSNPKDAIGSDKLPLHLWPTTATAMGSIGLLEGMLKYGRNNWRVSGVRASIYVDACKRHLDAWFEGEEVAPDSGVPHLANALACLAILVDAEAAGLLTDDRQYRGAGYRTLVESLTPHVARLKALHSAKSPKHYTIADMPAVDGAARNRG